MTKYNDIVVTALWFPFQINNEYETNYYRISIIYIKSSYINNSVQYIIYSLYPHDVMIHSYT